MAISRITFAALIVGSFAADLSATSYPLRGVLLPAPTFGQQGALFGYSIAGDGDYVAVGAPFADTDGVTDHGGVSIFRASTGEVLFHLQHPQRRDQFGISVARANNLVVVGAWYGESVYIYDLSGATPETPVQVLTNPAGQGGFGVSVAISGNLLAVGASSTIQTGRKYGTVFIYDLAGATPTVPITTVYNPNPSINDYFGTSVALSGNYLVVGAPYNNSNVDYGGLAYVFNLAGPTPAAPSITLQHSTNIKEHFGISTAIYGTTAIVGTIDPTGANAAYVYDLTSATPEEPVTILSDPNPPQPGRPYKVAVSANLVALGAAGAVAGTNGGSGSVYLFDLQNPVPTTPIATVTNPTPSYDQLFGFAIAIPASASSLLPRMNEMPAGSNLARPMFTILIALMLRPRPCMNTSWILASVSVPASQCQDIT